MVTLFEVFAARFSHRWTKTYEDEAARAVWTRDLAAAGLTPDLIEYGLKRTARLEWPPTVGEFIKACEPQPEEMGLPSTRDAYLAACRGNTRLHPIVWHVAQKIGTFELRTRSERETWPVWEGFYENAVCEARLGRVFEIPQVPLIEYQPPPVTGGAMSAKEALDTMRRAVGLPPRYEK